MDNCEELIKSIEESVTVYYEKLKKMHDMFISKLHELESIKEEFKSESEELETLFYESSDTTHYLIEEIKIELELMREDVKKEIERIDKHLEKQN